MRDPLSGQDFINPSTLLLARFPSPRKSASRPEGPPPAGGGAFPPGPRRSVEYLPGVHDPVRVEDALDAAHELDLPFVEDEREVGLFDQPDAVFARDDPAPRLAVPEKLLADE